jgi:hypothetical protein
MKMLKYDEKASKSDLYARVKLAPVNAIERSIHSAHCATRMWFPTASCGLSVPFSACSPVRLLASVT